MRGERVRHTLDSSTGFDGCHRFRHRQIHFKGLGRATTDIFKVIGYNHMIFIDARSLKFLHCNEIRGLPVLVSTSVDIYSEFFNGLVNIRDRLFEVLGKEVGNL